MDKISKDTIRVYDLIADKYNKEFFNDFSNHEMVDKFLLLLPKKAKILDIGCGPGGFVKYAIEKGFDARGIDLSENMISIAKQRVPSAQFSIMDMEKMTFPDNSFDAIFCTYTVIHTPASKIKAVLSEFNRVLKQKGIMYLVVFKGQGESYIDEPLMKGQKIFTKYFSQPEIKDLLKQTNFSIIEITEKFEGGDMGAEELYVMAQKN